MSPYLNHHHENIANQFFNGPCTDEYYFCAGPCTGAGANFNIGATEKNQGDGQKYFRSYQGGHQKNPCQFIG